MTCRIVLAVVASVIFACTISCVAPRQQSPSADASSLFTAEVKPILERNCLRCHNGASRARALDLRNRALAFSSRQPDGRPFIVPGYPDRSLFVTAVSRLGTHPKMMPQQPLSLSDMEIGLLRDWISAGAWWPAGTKGELHAQPNPENP